MEPQTFYPIQLSTLLYFRTKKAQPLSKQAADNNPQPDSSSSTYNGKENHNDGRPTPNFFTVVADSQPECPILNLPREVRNHIFRYAIEPAADFLLSDNNIDTGAGFISPIITSMEQEGDVVEADYEEWRHFRSIDRHKKLGNGKGEATKRRLTYRLRASSKLPFTCWQALLEIKDELDSLPYLIGKSVSRKHTFVSAPEARFLDLFSRSRLVFGHFTVHEWVCFWTSLPDGIRLHLTHITIGPFGPTSSREHTDYLPCFGYLLTRLPALKLVEFLGDPEMGELWANHPTLHKVSGKVQRFWYTKLQNRTRREGNSDTLMQVFQYDDVLRERESMPWPWLDVQVLGLFDGLARIDHEVRGDDFVPPVRMVMTGGTAFEH